MFSVSVDDRVSAFTRNQQCDDQAEIQQQGMSILSSSIYSSTNNVVFQYCTCLERPFIMISNNKALNPRF